MIYEVDVKVNYPRLSMASDVVFSTVELPQKGETKELKMSIVSPIEAPGKPFEKKMPCIIWLSGGAWMGSFRDKDLPAVIDLAKHGYIIAAVDYRTSGEALWPAQIQDVQTAVRYLRAHAEVLKMDSDHIGVIGGSAGGHLASMAGMNLEEYATQEWKEYSSEVQCVVSLFGISNLTVLKDDKINCKATRPTPPPKGAGPGFPYALMTPPDPMERLQTGPSGRRLDPEEVLIGGVLEEHMAEAIEASPVKRISERTCPILLLHGDNDSTVPCEQAKYLHDALNAAGHPTDYFRIKGAGHGDEKFFQEEIINLIVEFLDKHLK